MLAGEVGLFAATNLAAGEVLFGHQEGLFVLPHEEVAELPPATRRWVLKWCVGWPEGYVVPTDSDALSLTWFFNHHCDGNVGFDGAGRFVALREIAPGEELTYDYALADVTTDPILERCGCGGQHCRGRVSGLDWRDDAWWRRQGERAHPAVRAARAGAAGR